MPNPKRQHRRRRPGRRQPWPASCDERQRPGVARILPGDPSVNSELLRAVENPRNVTGGMPPQDEFDDLQLTRTQSVDRRHHPRLLGIG
jgi:hypothetical protein